MSHKEVNGALPANAWLDKEQLMTRLREEEIVEIDDFFTNVATKELIQKANQQKQVNEQPKELANPFERETGGDSLLHQPPLLSFGIDKKNETEPPNEQTSNELLDPSEMKGMKAKRKRLEEMTKRELVTYLAKIPAVMPNPVCDFMIEDGKRLRGTVEKVKGEYVYIKVAFGKKWIKYTLQQIKEIKIVRF